MADPYFPDVPHVYLPSAQGIEPLERWEATEECSAELEQLRVRDVTTWQTLVSLLERYSRNGAPADEEYELDAPVGNQFKPQLNGPQPWLGELRIEINSKKIGGGEHYRLYFGDLSDVDGKPPAQMIASLAGKKWTSSRAFDRSKVRTRQNDAMQKAMRRIIHWCGKNDRVYRHLRN